MRHICFYFQVHQPFRLRTYRFFEIGKSHQYYDEFQNRSLMKRIAEKCYIPANKLMLELIKKYPNDFKISYSITGLALEQFEMYAPEVLKSFKELAKTGHVEFLAETYNHSLASLTSETEFVRQVEEQSSRIHALFGQKPKVFRNTELIYSDRIGELVLGMGYKTVLTEGAKQILGWKSPNFMYHHSTKPELNLLLKNFRLSDDIAFRFSNQSWSEWPLTAEKYTGWLNQIPANQKVVNIFIDYETFGEHQWKDTGIFNFLEALPGKILSTTNFKFATPGELAEKLEPVSGIKVPFPISWADEERDITAWMGNELQKEAVLKFYALEKKIQGINEPALLKDWNYLQASDHFYYMSTKWFSDGDVHRYFNPYPSPYEAFINYMNVLSDFSLRIDEYKKTQMSKYYKDSSGSEEGEEKARTGLIDRDKLLPLNALLESNDLRIKRLLKGIDTNQLALALKEAELSVLDKILKNSDRNFLLEFYKYDRKLSSISLNDINESRKAILKRLSEQK